MYWKMFPLNVIIFEGMASGRQTIERGALFSEISVPVNKSFLILCHHVMLKWDGTICEPGGGPLPVNLLYP